MKKKKTKTKVKVKVKAKRSKKKFWITFVLVVIALILATTAVHIFVYGLPGTKGEPAKESTFKVCAPNGAPIESTTNMTLVSDGIYTFTTNEDYTLQIAPNKESDKNNFAYKVNGETKHFFNETAFITAFYVTFSERAFTLTLPKDANVLYILKQVYGADAQIELPTKLPAGKLFTMIIKNGEGETYYINFNLSGALTVKLPDTIIF